MTFSGFAGVIIPIVILPLVVVAIFWFVYGKLIVTVFKNLKDFGGAVLKSAASSALKTTAKGLKGLGDKTGSDNLADLADNLGQASAGFSAAAKTQLSKTDTKAGNYVPAAMQAFSQSGNLKEFVGNTRSNKKALDSKADADLKNRIQKSTAYAKRKVTDAVDKAPKAMNDIKDAIKNTSFQDIKNSLLPSLKGGTNKNTAYQNHTTGSTDNIDTNLSRNVSESGTAEFSTKSNGVSTDMNSLYSTGVKVTPDQSSPAEVALKNIALEKGLKAVLGSDGEWRLKAVGEAQVDDVKVALAELGRQLEIEKLKANGIEIPSNAEVMSAEKTEPKIESIMTKYIGSESDTETIQNVRNSLNENGLVEGADYKLNSAGGRVYLEALGGQSIDALDSMIINTPVEIHPTLENSVVDVDGSVEAEITDFNTNCTSTDEKLVLNKDYVIDGEVISFTSPKGISVADDLGLELDDISLVGTVNSGTVQVDNEDLTVEMMSKAGVEYSVNSRGEVIVDGSEYKILKDYNSQVLQSNVMANETPCTMAVGGSSFDASAIEYKCSDIQMDAIKRNIQSYDIPEGAVKIEDGMIKYIPKYRDIVEGAIKSSSVVNVSPNINSINAEITEGDTSVELLEKLGIEFTKDVTGKVFVSGSNYRALRDYNSIVGSTNFDSNAEDITMDLGGQEVLGRELSTELSKAKVLNVIHKLHQNGYSDNSVYLKDNGNLVYDSAASSDVNNILREESLVKYKTDKIDIVDLANKGYISKDGIVESGNAVYSSNEDEIDKLASGKFNTDTSKVIFDNAALTTLIPNTFTRESEFVLKKKNINYMKNADGSLQFIMDNVDADEIANLRTEIMTAGLFECVSLEVTKEKVSQTKFLHVKDDFARLFENVAGLTTENRIVIYPDKDLEYERIKNSSSDSLKQFLSNLQFETVLGVQCEIKGRVIELSETKVLGSELTETEILVTPVNDEELVMSQIRATECTKHPLFISRDKSGDYIIEMSSLQYKNCKDSSILGDLDNLYSENEDCIRLDKESFEFHFDNNIENLMKWVASANLVSLPHIVFRGAEIPKLVEEMHEFIEENEAYINGNSLVLLSYASRIKFRELQTGIYKDVVNRTVEAGNKYSKEHSNIAQSTKDVLGKPNRQRVCDITTIELDEEIVVNKDYIDGVIQNIEKSGLFREFGVVSSNIYFSNSKIIIESDTDTSSSIQDILDEEGTIKGLLSCSIGYESNYEYFFINYVADDDGNIERTGYAIDIELEEKPEVTVQLKIQVYFSAEGILYRINPINGIASPVDIKYADGASDMTATMFKNSISEADERNINRDIFIQYANGEEKEHIIESAKLLFYLNISDYMFDDDLDRMGIEYVPPEKQTKLADVIALSSGCKIGVVSGILKARSSFNELRALGITTSEQARKFIQEVTDEDLLESESESASYLNALNAVSKYCMGIHRNKHTKEDNTDTDNDEYEDEYDQD